MCKTIQKDFLIKESLVCIGKGGPSMDNLDLVDCTTSSVFFTYLHTLYLLFLAILEALKFLVLISEFYKRKKNKLHKAIVISKTLFK